MDFFSAPGIATCAARLNESAAFHEAARHWNGRLLLISEQPGADARYAWIVIVEGRCVEARTGALDDQSGADFVLAAADSAWTSLGAGILTPATAALTGKLSLRKGDVMSLLPHIGAATTLLAVMAKD